MQYKSINFHPEQEHETEPDARRCPKCKTVLTRYLAWEQPGCRVYSYHCHAHGDVVPVENHA